MNSIINLRDVAFEYYADHELFNKLNFTLNHGETVFIHGTSGCGKSTFLKLLNRLIEPSSGVMEFMGKPYKSLDVLALRRSIQLVQQTPFLFPVSVEENLRIADRSLNVAQAGDLLQSFNLPVSLLSQNGRSLSVGQAQRVCVIRSLLMGPEVMLMDEPTAALDPANRDLFFRSLQEVGRRAGFASVWITHEDASARRGDGRHLTLRGGRLHGD